MKDTTLLKKSENNKINLEKIMSSKDQVGIDLGPSYKEIKEDINSIVNTPINKWDEKKIAEKIEDAISTYELISICDNINFNAFLDDIILPIVYEQDKYLDSNKPKIERIFRVRYKLENKYQKKASDFKEESFPLDEKLIKLKEEMEDYKFTLRLILEKENLKGLMDKRIDEIEKNGIFIEIDHSIEDDIVNYNKKFKNKENKKKRLYSKEGYPIITQILRRVKKKKRLGKKAFDIVNKLRDIPQKLYEDLYKKVCGKEYNPLNPLNETQFQKAVVKIHEYLTEIDQNITSNKKRIDDLNQAALYYLDVILGRPKEPNKALYKARKIKPKYKKDRLDSIDKKAISDLFAATVKVEKDCDINKIVYMICTYLEQNPGDCYATNKEFKSRASNPNFDGVVQIKDYRGKNIKKNKFEGVQMRIRRSGTDMEILLMTEENYNKSKGSGEASHTEYKFFQRLMREVSLYKNPNQKFKYDSIMGFFEKMR